MTDTLRNRLHAHFHVADPATFRCGGVAEDCTLFPNVIQPLELLVAGWLRDKADQYGDVSLGNLAMYAEEGQA